MDTLAVNTIKQTGFSAKDSYELLDRFKNIKLKMKAKY